MPQVLKVIWSLFLGFLAESVHNSKTRLALFVLFVSNAVRDAKELSVAGERIRHSLDLTEVLQDFN